MKCTLKQSVTNSAKLAKTLFERNGELLPFYHAFSSTGEQFVFPAPLGDKDKSTELVRAYLKQIEATRVLFMAEAWSAETQSRDLADKIVREGVSKQPSRIEILMIVAEDHDEGTIHAKLDIIRRSNHATLGELEFMDFSNAEGRMVGLLPQQGTVQ